MKKGLFLLSLAMMSLQVFAYSETECVKDAMKVLRESKITSIYSRALVDLADSSETAKGIYLGVQDTTDATIQNAFKTFCKLQEEAARY